MRIKDATYMLALAFLAGLGLNAAGCATQIKRSEGAVVSLTKLTAEIGNADKQLHTTSASLQQVVAQKDGNLKAAYAKFVDEVGNLDSARERVKSIVEDMTARSNEYYKVWEEEIDQLASAELKARAQERRTQAVEKFGKIKTAGESLRATFLPFFQELKDIERYLASDLTSGGVKAITEVITKAEKDGQTTSEKAGTLITEIQSALAELPKLPGKTSGQTKPPAAAQGSSPAGQT